MTKQEFNGLVAEFLGLEQYPSIDGVFYRKATSEDKKVDPDSVAFTFNPYDDANDMLLLEEKLNMYTLPPANDGDKWTAFTRDTMFDFNQIAGYGYTSHESRRSCAEKYLKEWKK